MKWIKKMQEDCHIDYSFTNTLTGDIVGMAFPACDPHVHLRDENDGRLQMSAPMTARQFNWALVMPNTSPPVCTAQDAIAYRDRILRYSGDGFEPIMALYLTEETTPEDIREAAKHPFIKAVKYYPAHGTTGAASGVHDIRKMYHVFEAMAEHGLILSLHGEVVGDPYEVDIHDGEGLFVDEHLMHIFCNIGELKMVLEHITTEKAVRFVQAITPTDGTPPRLAATITAHHLMINRNHVVGRSGIQSHNHCLPTAKREKDRQALLAAATSGSPAFFLGTDSAPHEKGTKENACGCAGCFTGLHALELCAEEFDHLSALRRLPNFVGKFGAEFYGLESLMKRWVILERQDWEVPKIISYGDDRTIVPFWAGKILHWKQTA
jgi:dihydroorotase